MSVAITYDYKTIKVKKEFEHVAIDAYRNLGWELTTSSICEGNIFCINLSFKRNRKIENKMQLLKFGEQVDSIIKNIEILNNKKKSAGVTSGLTIGTVGALTFGGGMSMVLLNSASLGFLIGGIALGVVGAAVALSAYFISRRNKTKTLMQVQPMLESEYDKLADICEQSNSLLKD